MLFCNYHSRYQAKGQNMTSFHRKLKYIIGWRQKKTNICNLVKDWYLNPKILIILLNSYFFLMVRVLQYQKLLVYSYPMLYGLMVTRGLTPIRRKFNNSKTAFRPPPPIVTWIPCPFHPKRDMRNIKSRFFFIFCQVFS